MKEAASGQVSPKRQRTSPQLVRFKEHCELVPSRRLTPTDRRSHGPPSLLWSSFVEPRFQRHPIPHPSIPTQPENGNLEQRLSPLSYRLPTSSPPHLHPLSLSVSISNSQELVLCSLALCVCVVFCFNFRDELCRSHYSCCVFRCRIPSRASCWFVVAAFIAFH